MKFGAKQLKTLTLKAIAFAPNSGCIMAPSVVASDLVGNVFGFAISMSQHTGKKDLSVYVSMYVCMYLSIEPGREGYSGQRRNDICCLLGMGQETVINTIAEQKTVTSILFVPRPWSSLVDRPRRPWTAAARNQILLLRSELGALPGREIF